MSTACMHFITAKFDILLSAVNLPGVDNEIADALSRDNLTHFFLQASAQPLQLPSPSIDLFAATNLNWTTPIQEQHIQHYFQASLSKTTHQSYSKLYIHSKQRLPLTSAIMILLNTIRSPAVQSTWFDSIMILAASLVCFIFIRFLHSGEITNPSLSAYDPSVYLNVADIVVDKVIQTIKNWPLQTRYTWG